MKKDPNRPEKIKERLLTLNGARRGSLGEFIFEQECISKRKIIDKIHKERVDFSVEGYGKIDVKTTFRNINRAKKTVPYRIYRGLRKKHINYVIVDFFSDGVRISSEELITTEINLKKMVAYWDLWRNNDEKKVKSSIPTNAILFIPIKKKIVNYFNKNLGQNTRVIYRTVQKGFGSESPHNLIPKIIRPNYMTVFIDFNDENISPQNIHQIIAFPDKDAKSFPRLKNPKLHLEKVNIEKLNRKYKFKDIKDLFMNFSIRFKLKQYCERINHEMD